MVASTATWAASLRRLVRRALRWREFSFAPRGEVERAASAEFDWQATGTRPSFTLVPPQGRYPERWVEVEFQLRGERGILFAPYLLVDHGSGEVAASRVRLPDPVGGRVAALVRLPRPVRGLTLIPNGQRGQFTLGKISIRSLSSLEVGMRLGLPYAPPVLHHPRRLGSALQAAYGLWRRDGVLGIKRQLAGEYGVTPSISYREWIKRYDTLSDWDRARIRERLTRLNRHPLISILLPLEDCTSEALSQSLQSVQSQLYSNWELWIAGTTTHEFGAGDRRVRSLVVSKASGLADSLNSALDQSTGEFVTVLRAGDRLAEHSLYMLAEELNASPNASLIYTDEDRIDEDGEPTEHHFKSDWNPDLFYSCNYVSHLTAIKRDLIEKAGRFRNRFAGWEEYDLLLRCVDGCDSHNIRHIAHVLYHAGYRSQAHEDTSTAVAVVREHLRAKMPLVEVEPGVIPGACHVRHALPSQLPLVSIMIPTRDRPALLERCIESLISKTDYSPREIILVDNQSSDVAALRYLRKLAHAGQARVLEYNRPFNYSAINNLAAREAKGEVLAFLNNDLEVISPQWLSEMVALAVRPETAAVGALLYYPHDRIQHAGVIMGMRGLADHVYRGLERGAWGYHGRAGLVQNLSAVTAACLVLRRDTFKKLGGFDESLPVSFNDLDLCLRAKSAGYRNVFTPHAELYHHESASRGSDDSPEKQLRLRKEIEIMYKKWGEGLLDDPFFNANLSLDHVYPSLGCPPRSGRKWWTQR